MTLETLEVSVSIRMYLFVFVMPTLSFHWQAQRKRKLAAEMLKMLPIVKTAQKDRNLQSEHASCLDSLEELYLFNPIPPFFVSSPCRLMRN